MQVSERKLVFPSYNRVRFVTKIRSLSEEIRIIRSLIKKSGKRISRGRSRSVQDIATLQGHLDFVVKPEVRGTLIAYAFMRNVPYKQVENSSRSLPSSVVDIAVRTLKSLANQHTQDIEMFHRWLTQ